MSDDSMKLLNRILDEGIKPYTEELAPIIADGDVAIVVFEPADDVKPALRAAGWDGRAHVLRMPNGYRKRLARSSDAVTRAWLTRSASVSGSAGRIFLFVQRGTLLVNFSPERGYSLEPGSTDAERV